jgi:hypothetical protein
MTHPFDPGYGTEPFRTPFVPTTLVQTSIRPRAFGSNGDRSFIVAAWTALPAWWSSARHPSEAGVVVCTYFRCRRGCRPEVLALSSFRWAEPHTTWKKS